MAFHKYTQAEDDYIRLHYPDKPTKEIAEYLNLKVMQIHHRAHFLGLHKSKEYLNSVFSGRFPECYNQQATQFKKGHITWNKGRKWDHQPEACKRTQFKKGLTPLNTKPEGYIVERAEGYFFEKYNGKMIPIQQAVWMRHNGDIPAGMIVVFKDKNRKNYDISNLEMISKRDNIIRNSIQRYPPELRSVMKALKKLNKTILNQEKNGTEQIG